jgi:hypothetical protein
MPLCRLRIRLWKRLNTIHETANETADEPDEASNAPGMGLPVPSVSSMQSLRTSSNKLEFWRLALPVAINAALLLALALVVSALLAALNGHPHADSRRRPRH